MRSQRVCARHLSAHIDHCGIRMKLEQTAKRFGEICKAGAKHRAYALVDFASTFFDSLEFSGATICHESNAEPGHPAR